jgi:hypothetical protein
MEKIAGPFDICGILPIFIYKMEEKVYIYIDFGVFLGEKMITRAISLGL